VRIARLAAARHGMYLDEYGLWRWHSSEEAMLESQKTQSHSQPNQSNADNGGTQQRQPNGGGCGYWELVEGESEDRILDELELGAIAPQRRNFRFLASKKRASARAGTFDFHLAEEVAEEAERRER
jgi:DNA polymerase beta